ncbi:hypothetical protein EXS74_01100 [Candidatus Woesearchaeota archaeon]|nr:hypothetical protein [Candidatus Woesearchaeota archaeon]
MIWTILFYLFLILVFLVYLKLSTFRLNGKKILHFPMRVALALIFPLIFILVALFSSLLLLFVMALLLIALLLFLILFFIGRVQIFSKKSKVSSRNTVIIQKVKK